MGENTVNPLTHDINHFNFFLILRESYLLNAELKCLKISSCMKLMPDVN